MNKLMQQIDFGAFGAASSRFFGWWASELLAPLPNKVKKLIARSALIDHQVGGVAEPGQSLRLMLAEDQLLSKIIKLPRGAEKSLGAAMALQIERMAPLAPDKMLTCWTVVDRSDEQITVLLEMARLDSVMAEIGRIEAGGATITEIISQETAGCFNGCAHLITRQTKKHLLDFAFYTAVASVFMLAFILVSSRLDTAICVAETKVDALRAASRELVSVRRVIAAHKNNADFIKVRLDRPEPLALLERLTSALPESAYLHSLKIDGDEVVIIGETGNAAALAVELGKNNRVASVALRSVNPSGALERFEMVVRLEREEAAGG